MLQTATAANIEQNISQYMQSMESGDEIIIFDNGQEIGRLVPKGVAVSFLTDSLVGILKKDCETKPFKQLPLIE
ncbi:MAG: hypothetical protein J6O04_00320 [Selenomonadaceae bacterium]|nr:hypothetical protein [Selenomonadaceae bacterium]